ncbi:hypothetical protein EON63_18615 [archaeon]|nr:MAG: hypothetical protein EON63_18615 [archaeon]
MLVPSRSISISYTHTLPYTVTYHTRHCRLEGAGVSPHLSHIQLEGGVLHELLHLGTIFKRRGGTEAQELLQ